jgi:Domain of unknown function (DUF4148)
MNGKLAITFAALMAAGSTSFAQTTEYVDFSNVVSTKSRAEVKAELAAARAAGMLDVREGTYPDFETANIASTKTRAEVQAELATARADGSFEMLNSEYPRFAPMTGVGRERSEVIAELEKFKAAYPNDHTNVDYPTALLPAAAQSYPADGISGR